MSGRQRLHHAAAAAFSALLLPLSLPSPLFELGSPLLGIVALIPLYLALAGTDSVRSAARLGVLFGALSTTTGSFWLAFFQDFSVWTLGGAVAGYAVYNALLFPFLHRSLQARLPWRPLWFAAIWTGYELLKSIGFLGYPWGLIAYSWNEVIPFIQIADLFGVYGVSFLLVLTNAVLAEFCRESKLSLLQGTTALLAVLTVATWLYGFHALQRDIPRLDELDTVLVQNDGDAWQPGAFWQELEKTQDLTSLAVQHGPVPDMVIWSETILRYPIQEHRRLYRHNPHRQPFLEFLGELPVPLLTGGAYLIDEQQHDLINAALLLDQDGIVQQVYGKQQLVPFAETIPFFEFAPVRRFFAEVIGLRSMWLSGMEYRLFEVETRSGNRLQYGTPICFEDAFAHITRDMARLGADFFVNLTNNSWSRTESAQTQHFAAARFRSIETRRTLVRATNSGLTSVVDPWGRLSASLPMFTPTVLRTDVPIYRPRTESVYLLTGDLFAWICLLGSLAGLAAAWLASAGQATATVRLSSDGQLSATGQTIPE